MLRREPVLSIAKANSVVIGLQLVWRAGRGVPRGRTTGRAVGFSSPSGLVWLTLSLLSVADEPLLISVVTSGDVRHESKCSGAGR